MDQEEAGVLSTSSAGTKIGPGGVPGPTSVPAVVEAYFPLIEKA